MYISKVQHCKHCISKNEGGEKKIPQKKGWRGWLCSFQKRRLLGQERKGHSSIPKDYRLSHGEQ